MVSKLSEAKPMTIRAFLRKHGAPLSWSVRAAMSRRIDDALFTLWENAVNMYDGETAAVILFALVSKDPSFRLPLWLTQRFKAHQAAITNAVHSGDIQFALSGVEGWN